MSNFEWMDDEMEALVDSANNDARAKAMEIAEEFDILSQDVDKVLDSAEKEHKRKRGSEPGEAELSVIFVTASSIEHLKYVQSMRKFLKKEARKMVKELLAKRARQEALAKKARYT